MSTDLIRYDLMVQEALKGVVRRILSDAARDGLPGDHHFYVSFRTDHPGARISSRLREKYPRDMTIVLQHQFENLTISDSVFEVGLSFSGIAERLRVPFDALTGFFDPSVQFGLKFDTSDGEEAGGEAPGAAEPAEEPVAIGPGRKSDGKGSVPRLPGRKLEAVGDKADKKPRPDKETDVEKGAEVVSLDSFRKKS